MGFSLNPRKIIKGLGNFLGSTFNLAFLGIEQVFGLVTDALGFKLPKLPDSIRVGGRQYNADVRINESRLGDVKAVIYGQNVRDWPSYVSVPYTEFCPNDQRLNAYLHLSRGLVHVRGINIGDTPASTFSGIASELYAPGVDMTLFRPNVYTCAEVEQIELVGGIGGFDDTKKRITVEVRDTGTTVFTAGAFNGTITGSFEGFWDDFIVWDVIVADDAGGNTGNQFGILSITDDGRTATVFPPPAPGAASESLFVVVERWAGPYPACQPGATCSMIAVDTVFASLFNRDHETDTREAEMEVQYRPIDDAGNVLDETWQSETFTVSGNKSKPYRFTNEIALSGSMRPQVRLRRVTYEQNDPEDSSSAAQWVGLKGYIDPLEVDSPASDAFCSRLAISVRSSGLLAQASKRAVNVFVDRLLPIYEGGAWTEDQATSSPAWGSIDWLKAESQGNITDDLLDLPAFVSFAAFWETNNDTFDAIFDREVGLWEGAKTILRAGRASPVWDPYLRKFTVYRDEPADPVAMFCDGFSSSFGEDSIALPDADTVSGVLVQYTDPLLAIQRDGPLVGSGADPRRSPLMGFTRWEQAWREAQFQYRDLYYRTQTVSIRTEMDGLLPRFGHRVLLCSAVCGWGHAGEVMFQDGSDPNKLYVSPAPFWTEGMQHFVYLQGPDGVPGAKINVTQGDTPDILVLESEPDVALRTGEAWRTLFAFGHDGDEEGDIDPDAPRIAIVQKRTPEGLHGGSLDLVFDHPFVHEDPGEPPPDPYSLDGGIPDLTIENLTAEQEIAGAILDETGDPILDEADDMLLDETVAVGVVVSVDWDDVSGATLYQVWWKYDDETTWILTYSGIESQTQFSVPANGTVNVRVQAYSGTYVTLPPATVDVVIDAY